MSLRAMLTLSGRPIGRGNVADIYGHQEIAVQLFKAGQPRSEEVAREFWTWAMSG
jgi:hypothetical protein